MVRAVPEIVVYWRPGCPFCTALFEGLDRWSVPHRRVNIWEDPDGARTVRSFARGSETVPTVTVGPAALVNPSADGVIRAAETYAPALVPDGWEPAQPGRIGRWLERLLGGAEPV